MTFDEKEVELFLRKWQDVLRLRDWDIKYEIVNKEWKKTGDIKEKIKKYLLEEYKSLLRRNYLYFVQEVTK